MQITNFNEFLTHTEYNPYGEDLVNREHQFNLFKIRLCEAVSTYLLTKNYELQDKLNIFVNKLNLLVIELTDTVEGILLGMEYQTTHLTKTTVIRHTFQALNIRHIESNPREFKQLIMWLDSIV